ncbi:efflux transporter outer membrane subunit [Pseudomonas sp. 5P_3.1_Bac2]|uniref:efflux transporter outer membrane subunit n=1 Tax=Pseudomonas sp. 5P_3.1_Bac2 TaxID=2971617 RepID=UPI0021CA3541|nr:efflux transporter outer membrane subunit [Pseudomonas sp. 5P_3.1_Bac2]MCU1718104.1 efflux transporter outer membrane subunit [Pseudomonas sp. 5P_3.1_Bac2]
MKLLVKPLPLVAALLLAGCNLAPTFTPPEQPLPAQFEHGAQALHGVDASWWQAFGSTELTRFVERAGAGNLDLASAISRVRQADIQARVAGAPLLPSVSGNLVGNRNFAADNSGGGVRNAYSAGLSISYELDVWGKNRNNLSASEQNALATAYERDTVALTVAAATASSYLKVLELRERERIAVDNLANAEQVLKVAEAKTRLGASSELELLQQQTLVEQRRAAIPGLRQQRQTAENALAILLGTVPQGFAAQIKADSLNGLLLSQEQVGLLPSELLLRRPDIQAEEARLRAANADIGAARAALFPSLSLSGSSGYSADVFSNLFNSGNLASSLGASLLQPIFRGGALKGALELSQERYVELADGYRKTVIVALQEVEDALITLREGQQQYDSQRQVLAYAQKAFELAQLQYSQGSADILTVLSAQQSFFSARDSLLQNQSSQLQNQVQLYKVLGGGYGA